MFEYIRAVSEIRPRYFVWENVPGALSSDGGAAFGQLLREMDDLGYGLAWIVLDAQFFGVAQRRRRVFLVGCLGDARRAAEILFERESLRWDYPSSRYKRQELAATATRCSDGVNYCIQGDIARGAHLVQNGVGYSDDGVSYTLNTMDIPAVTDYQRHTYCLQGNMIGRKDSNGPQGAGTNDEIAFTLNTIDVHAVASVLHFDTTQITSPTNGNNPQYGDPCHPLCANAHVQTIAFSAGQSPKAGSLGLGEEIAPTLRSGSSGTNQVQTIVTTQFGEYKDAPIVSDSMIVRRLMPIECERLQGFPDNLTRIPYKGKSAEECPDTPRYKALGNSMAVPVMRWIGERIAMVDALGGQI